MTAVIFIYPIKLYLMLHSQGEQCVHLFCSLAALCVVFVLNRHTCNDAHGDTRQKLCSGCECVFTSAILCSPKNGINSEVFSITCYIVLYFSLVEPFQVFVGTLLFFGGSPPSICKC